MAANKYLDYAGLRRFKEKLDLEYASIAALVYKGSAEDVAALPALSGLKVGWMYNIETDDKTTTDFVEGSGHDIKAGENVAVVELITGYTPVPAGDVTPDKDPKALDWYESDGGLTPVYTPSEDRIADTGKTYFTATTVKKWDLLGGVFDLNGRYLEFGTEMPSTPSDGQRFLYVGEDTFEYNAVASPSGRPVDQGWYEKVISYDPVTPVGDEDPSAEGWYESDGLIPPTYTLSADTSVNPSKTYYEQKEEYQLTADVVVNPSKTYFTKDSVLVEGVLYKYDLATTSWVAESGSSSDMVPITNAEIDELFV